MTVIAQDVFTITMTLIDEPSQDGTFDGFPDEYKEKSWVLLSLLQSELVENTIPTPVTDNTTVLQLDDQTCLSVLPYGLAAHLLLTDDPNRASFFNSRYDELKGRIPSSVVAIQSVYTLDDYGTDTFDTSEPTTDPTTPTSNDFDGGEF